MLKRMRSLADGLFRRRRFEKSMSEELRFHVDAYAHDLVRSGLPAGEARRRARIEFGSVEAVKDECRQARGLQLLDELRQDLRYATRQMARSPVFTAAAVASLALGIGANTAILSVLDAALLRTLPIRDPDALFYLGHGSGSRITTSANYPLFERYGEAAVFEGVTAYSGETFLVTTPEGVERVNGQFASGNYHAVLGVPMILGRGFSAERDRAVGANPIAVISDGYWSRKYGRDPGVIGRSINVRGREVTIVGVTAPGFHGLAPGSLTDLTLPMSQLVLDEPGFLDARDGWVSLSLVARLKRGMNAAQAQAVVEPIFKRFWMEPENEWARQGPDAASRAGVIVPAGKGSAELRGRYGTPLRILMGMVAIVLLIACVNLANLLLARATTRAREVAVRLSIGAGRFRLIRQFLTESCLLACIGGLLGLVVADWSSRALLSFFDDGPYPVFLDVVLNARVLAFTAGISILTGVAFGLLPGLRATQVDLSPALKRSGGITSGHADSAVGKALVVAQIALCMVLVAASGLFVRSVRNLKSVEAGFARDNVLMFNVETGSSLRTTAQRLSYHAELLDRLRVLPGVASVSLAKRSPVDFSSELRRIEVPGYGEPNGPSGVSSNTVTTDYFRALGIGLVGGRTFTDEDRDGSARVVVVSESMARTWFGNTDALGRSIVLGGNRDTMSIVGIVRDVRHEGLREDAPRSVYTPLTQPTESFDGAVTVPDRLTVIVRTSGDPGLLTASVADQVRALGADAAVSWMRTMQQQLDAAHVRERLLARMSAAFGLLALILATTGLYGVMSYHVARRSRDIGIRMALGATRRATMEQIMRDVVIMALAGIAAGTALTLASTRMVASFLFGVSPHDPLTLAAVAAILLATILLAGFVPARQAARLDPVQTLKAE